MLCPKCLVQLEVKEAWDLNKLIYCCPRCGYSFSRTIPSTLKNFNSIGVIYSDFQKSDGDE